MTREGLVRLLAVVGIALGAWWLSVSTEWVEEETPRPAQGEARDNPVYAAEQMLRRLGMSVEHHEALDTLPPERARLVLLSSDWDLLPGRAEQLHQWVLRGGHLVLVQGSHWEETALAKWVPVEAVDVKPADRPIPLPARRRSGPRAVTPKAIAELNRVELASTPLLWDGTERVSACYYFHWHKALRAKPGSGVAWAMAQADGTPATQDVLAQQTKALEAMQVKQAPKATLVLRVLVGQGSVTMLNTDEGLFHNGPALACGNPLLLAAAVQAEPGATAWIYLNEKREALLPWLWHTGWIAIVAGALALAAALWRAAVRFGPRMAPAPRLRRSISEQVRGLGAYLQRGGREALLVAQQRALTEVATRTLPRFARLSLAERVKAIAAATGLAPAELSTAMSTRLCTRAELPQHLQLLETARRRLQRTPEERQTP